MKYNKTELTKQINKVKRKRQNLWEDVQLLDRQIKSLTKMAKVVYCNKCKNYIHKNEIEPIYTTKFEQHISNPNDWMNKYEYEERENYYKEYICPVCKNVATRELLTSSKIYK